MSGTALYPVVFLAGLFNGVAHAVIVVLAQRLLPRRRAFASGLTLGFMYASGAFGSYIFGLAADVYPLSLVLQTNSILCLLAALVLITILRRDIGLGSGGEQAVAAG